MADTGTSEMLLTTFNFAVEVDGVTIGYYKEASGLTSEVEVIEHQVVNEKGQQVTQKIAGHAQTGEVTLKKSLEDDKYLYDWFKEVTDGNVSGYRRNGSIVLYTVDGSETARWNFTNGWPKSYGASDLDAGGDDIITEEVTITHEGMERVK